MNVKAACLQALQDWRTRQGKHVNGYRCTFCKQLFVTHRELLEHSRTHTIRILPLTEPKLWYYRSRTRIAPPGEYFRKAPVPL